MSQEQSTSEFEFEFSEKDRATENPFSVAMMFYAISVAAILAACVRAHFSGSSSPKDALGYILFAGLILGVGSSFLVAICFLRYRYIPIISAVGAMIGLCAGVLAIVQPESYAQILIIAFGGGWLQILFMCLAARFRTQPHKSKPASE